MPDFVSRMIGALGSDLPNLLKQFWFWLTLTSLACFVAERLFPWRNQAVLRPQLAQDFLWLIVNGHFLGIALALVSGRALLAATRTASSWGIPLPENPRLLADSPFWLQFVVLLVFKDFLEWCVHVLFHRVRWLWALHKVHHSVETLDWIGYFRFHWLEAVVYKSLTFLPIVLLGFSPRVMLPVGVLVVAAGYLNHANLNISWGPLRYVLNSPRMHVWHHDVIPRGGHGTNFGMVFSVWDWWFGTAYLPSGYPEKLGFEGSSAYPRSFIGRLLYPLPVGGRETSATSEGDRS